MAYGHKTGGGSRLGKRNKLTLDVQAFVDRVFAKVDPIEKLESLLSGESEKVQAGVILRLLEYRYGKPKESLEVTGTISLAEVIERARQRTKTS